jgi:DNA modification methylase
VDEDSVEAPASAIADNRTGELAGWDDEGLVAMLQSMPDDLPDIGFTDDDLEQLIADLTPAVEIEEDEAPEPPADPVTRPGDLWTLGRHRVLCGDSTSGADVGRLGVSRDMACVTDPPYGVGFQYDEHDDGDNENNERMVRTALSACECRVWTPGAGNLARELSAEPDARVIVWNKKFGMTRGWLGGFHVWEPVLVVSPQIRDMNTDHIECMTDRDPALRGAHGCPKPVKLMATLIQGLTETDIFDPFLGSGTTLIAADQLGRTCYGMEISPAYCDVIVRRWEALTGSRAARVDSEGNEAGPMPEPQEAAVAAGG